MNDQVVDALAALIITIWMMLMAMLAGWSALAFAYIAPAGGLP